MCAVIKHCIASVYPLAGPGIPVAEFSLSAFSGASDGASGGAKPKIRKQFPETWIWDDFVHDR